MAYTSNPPSYILNNLLVPLGGKVSTVEWGFTASAQAQTFDFGNYNNNVSGPSFIPQGAIVDNSQGTAPLVVTSQIIGFSFVVPAGAQRNVMLLAALNDTFSATGAGNVQIFFCNFPIFLNSGDVVEIAGQPIGVNIENTPIPVTVSAVLATQVNALQAYPASGSLAGASGNTTTSFNVAVPAGTAWLRKLRIGLTAAATQATAGDLLLTATLGTKVWQGYATVGTAAGVAYHTEIDCGALGFPVGTATDLVISTTNPLLSGTCDCNAVFSAV